MSVSTGELQPFVDWKCRDLIYDTELDFCTDEERAVFQECFDLYPERVQPNARACLDRITAEEVEKATKDKRKVR